MKEQLLELNQGSREDLIKAREKLVEKIEDLSLKSCKRIIRAYSFVDAIDNLDDYTKNLSEEEKLLFAQFAIYITCRFSSILSCKALHFLHEDQKVKCIV